MTVYSKLFIFIIVLFSGCQSIRTYNSVYTLNKEDLVRSEKKANAGDEKAAYDIFMHYWIGLRDTNPEKTTFWLKKSAELGDARAQFNLGFS